MRRILLFKDDSVNYSFTEKVTVKIKCYKIFGGVMSCVFCEYIRIRII